MQSHKVKEIKNQNLQSADSFFIANNLCEFQWTILLNPTKTKQMHISNNHTHQRGEWPSGLYSLCQVTEVKFGRVRSDFAWVTTEA